MTDPRIHTGNGRARVQSQVCVTLKASRGLSSAHGWLEATACLPQTDGDHQGGSHLGMNNKLCTLLSSLPQLIPTVHTSSLMGGRGCFQLHLHTISPQPDLRRLVLPSSQSLLPVQRLHVKGTNEYQAHLGSWTSLYSSLTEHWSWGKGSDWGFRNGWACLGSESSIKKKVVWEQRRSPVGVGPGVLMNF